MERTSNIRRTNIAADIDVLRNQYNNIFNSLISNENASVDDLIRETDSLFRGYLRQYGLPRNVERYIDNEEYWVDRDKFRTMKVRILEGLGNAYKNGALAGRHYKVIPVSDQVRGYRHYNVGHAFITVLKDRDLQTNDVTEIKKATKDWKGVRPGGGSRRFGDPFGIDYMNYPDDSDDDSDDDYGPTHKADIIRKRMVPQAIRWRNVPTVEEMVDRLENTYREYRQDHFIEGAEKPRNDVITDEQENFFALEFEGVRYSQFSQYAAARYKSELEAAEMRTYESEMEFEQDPMRAPRVSKATGGMGTMSRPRTIYNINEMVKVILRDMLNQQQNFFNKTEKREIWFNRAFRMRWIIDHLIFNYMEMKLPMLRNFDFKAENNRNRDDSIRNFYTQRFFLDLGHRLMINDAPLNESSEYILRMMQRYINARFYDDDMDFDGRLNGDELLMGNFGSARSNEDNNYVKGGMGASSSSSRKRDTEAVIGRARDIVRQAARKRSRTTDNDRFARKRDRKMTYDEWSNLQKTEDSDEDSDTSTVILDDIDDDIKKLEKLMLF